MKDNISIIVKSDLCVSCGACSKACDSGAINLKFEKGLFIPFVDEIKCSFCGKCLKTCPSHKIDFQKTYDGSDFNQDGIECYVAYTKDKRLRHQGTSGGVVSSMVFDLLRNGEYEKAYTLEFESFGEDRAKLHAVTNPDDVIRTVKSKYIPASVEEVIEDINEDRISKSIVVGTPCQFLAIKRHLSLRRKENEDILFIGLFCDKTLNYNIYRYYELKYGKSDSLHFRDKDGNAWPGDTVLSNNGKKTIVNKTVRMSLKPYFQLNRCRYCFDKLNQLADISCGDCYIPGQESAKGKSSVIIRTERGRMAFEACKDNIECSQSSFAVIKESQKLMIKLENVARNQLPSGVFVNIPLDLINTVVLNEKDEKKARKQMSMGKELSAMTDVIAIDEMIKKENSSPQKSKWKKAIGRLGKVLYNPDKRMKVLIDEIGFVNKGAELMLYSIVDQLQRRMPDALIVLQEKVFYQNPSYCISNHIVPLQNDTKKLKRLVKLFAYRNLLNEPWYVTPDQIDVVLDAGGFRFGDQWKYSDSQILQKKHYYSSFSKKERKIIFLPQAFGPFIEEFSCRMMRCVYEFADVMYAREKVSYEYLKELFPGDKKIKQSPDFTCLCNGARKKTVVLPENYVLIVPNSRMITHSEQRVSTYYLSFLKEITSFLMEKGENVVWLNHEGEDDEKLMNEINRESSHKIILLSNLDALEVKRIIGSSKLLISSRFHGVVSGLTQGVPTLCTSWSHKYFELLKEHSCEGNILNVNDVQQSMTIIQQALENPEEYVSKDGCLNRIKEQSEIMWDEVFDLIDE